MPAKREKEKKNSFFGFFNRGVAKIRQQLPKIRARLTRSQQSALLKEAQATYELLQAYNGAKDRIQTSLARKDVYTNSHATARNLTLEKDKQFVVAKRPLIKYELNKFLALYNNYEASNHKRIAGMKIYPFFLSKDKKLVSILTKLKQEGEIELKLMSEQERKELYRNRASADELEAQASNDNVEEYEPIAIFKPKK